MGLPGRPRSRFPPGSLGVEKQAVPGTVAISVPSQTFSPADVILGAIERALDSVWTALPGVVQSYDATKQLVSVQPAILNAFDSEVGDRKTERLPVVQGVPVMFPGSGNGSLTFPLTQGASGLLVFCCRSIDQWLARGGNDVDPLHDHKHLITDAVFFPGLRSIPGALNPAPSTTAMVLTHPDVRLGSKDASDPVALKSDLQAFVDGLSARVTVLNGEISTATSGLPGTATVLAALQAELATVQAVQAALPPGFPVCAQKVRAE